jgi:hypothetical protein
MAAIMLMMCAGAILPACSSAPRRARHIDTPPGGGSCAFAPVAILVHPLSRLVIQPGKEPRIDAHIEMRDAAGDEVKGAGKLVLELHRGSGAFTGAGMRQPALRWETDLADAQENSRAFDRVTRTYRFELTGIAETIGTEGGLRLRAVLTTGDGRELADEMGLDR